MKTQSAFSGKHIRGNSAKLAQLKKREKRLRKMALSVLSFIPGAQMPWVQYFKNRNETRPKAKAE